MTFLLPAHLAALALLLASAQSGVRADDSRGCPPWFVPQESDDSTNCTCGSSLNGIVSCPDEQLRKLKLMPCYCMTSWRHNATVVGRCRYSCAVTNKWYSDPTQLDYHMCSEFWKRSGTLCYKCMDGYGPPIYSYSLKCIQCPSKGSLLLFFASFVLLAVFCLMIMILRISIARPPMSTFVLVSQVMASQNVLELLLVYKPGYLWKTLLNRKLHKTAWGLFAAFYGLWNLDLLRSFYPQICLSPHMSTLQAQLLEYAIALFPLAMLLAIYHSVRLYDSGRRGIFRVCRPVHTCLARLRRSIDIRTSLIDAFATFIILSVNKVGYTSVSILQPVYVYSPYGNHSVYVYLDPTMEYFGWGHLPYVLVALTLSFALILVPLSLLLVYPSRRFQTFLNHRGWQCQVLHVFADAFLGCYKDGMNGTRDCRWFAAVNISMRCVAIFPLDHFHLSYSVLIAGVALYMTLLVVFQPYKKLVHQKQDMVLLFGLMLWNTAMSGAALSRTGWDMTDVVVNVVILALGSLVPVVYVAGLLVHWLMVVKKVHTRILNKLRLIHFSSDRMRLLGHSAEF